MYNSLLSIIVISIIGLINNVDFRCAEKGEC